MILVLDQMTSPNEKQNNYYLISLYAMSVIMCDGLSKIMQSFKNSHGNNWYIFKYFEIN